MNRTMLMSSCIAAVALSVACSRDAAQADKKNIVDLATHPAPAGSIAPVEVVGCLSAAGNRFVLTHADKDDAKTIAYQLVNADDKLTALVGREVRVTGEAQPTQRAETRAVTPPQPAATSGKSATDAKVTTVEETKVDMQKLSVASVAPTGDNCPR